MTQRKQRCTLPGCNNVATYKKARVCERCYQFLYYWQGRSVSDKMAHVNRVGFWNERVAALLPARVSRIKGKRRTG